MWAPNAAAQEKPLNDPLFERGMALVGHNCGRCHAIGSEGESSHSEAPPFRDLLQRYPIDALEESFIDEIYSQHPDMPVFKVTPEQLDAILYYIAVIQRD
ncbi:MAG: c-type cytochrome [Rhizobiaceae bacterium]